MTIPVVRVGNSKGIRIPKALLDQYGNPERVELQAKKGLLVIRPLPARSRPRHGWEEACRQMAKLRHDTLLDAPLPATRWEKTEWEW
jgi:antitoxin MazE